MNTIEENPKLILFTEACKVVVFVLSMILGLWIYVALVFLKEKFKDDDIKQMFRRHSFSWQKD